MTVSKHGEASRAWANEFDPAASSGEDVEIVDLDNLARGRESSCEVVSWRSSDGKQTPVHLANLYDSKRWKRALGHLQSKPRATTLSALIAQMEGFLTVDERVCSTFSHLLSLAFTCFRSLELVC